jgi:SAM-dependent methyltransferase
LSETINIWSGEAELYADARPAPPSILLDICTQLVHMSQPNLVVDLGSGTGLSTLLWAGHARRVIGIEPDADMRLQAVQRTVLLPAKAGVEYRDGFSYQTGLADDGADIVTCSQALHWMEPGPTFVEVTRILRPGGLFVAYDYDWPPTTHWEVEQVYHEVITRFRKIRSERGVDREVKSWSKDRHLSRMRESRCFRFVKELVVHHIEKGNAERFVNLTLSYGIARYLKQGYLTAQEVGMDNLRHIVQDVIGPEPIPWYFSSVFYTQLRKGEKKRDGNPQVGSGPAAIPPTRFSSPMARHGGVRDTLPDGRPLSRSLLSSE